MRKNIFTLLLSVAFSAPSFAQYIRYGMECGVEISDFAADYPYKPEYSFHSKTGYKAAVIAEYAVIPNLFYLVSEFAFIQRGAKYEQVDTTYSDNINYLHLPVNVLLETEMQNEETKLFVFGGPYLSYAFSGKVKRKWEYNGLIESGETKTKFSYEGDYKPIDLGFNIGVGVKYFDYLLKIQYDYGVINLLNNQHPNIRKNRNFGITLGYLF
jgi:hypothetical protein